MPAAPDPQLQRLAGLAAVGPIDSAVLDLIIAPTPSPYAAIAAELHRIANALSTIPATADVNPYVRVGILPAPIGALDQAVVAAVDLVATAVLAKTGSTGELSPGVWTHRAYNDLGIALQVAIHGQVSSPAERMECERQAEVIRLRHALAEAEARAERAEALALGSADLEYTRAVIAAGDFSETPTDPELMPCGCPVGLPEVHQEGCQVLEDERGELHRTRFDASVPRGTVRHLDVTDIECTHGGDCLLHPAVRQPHNFDHIATIHKGE